jgi:uncharacterized protein (DUF488 family)
MKVFTLGYQGLSLEKYVETLLASNVGIVLDVREVAWSYNRRYIKSVLQKTLLEAGIKYTHLRVCGNPSANRKTATSIEECLSRYRDYLKENSECLEILLEYVEHASKRNQPACLTCYEHKPEECHRNILTDSLLEIAPELQITHLKYIEATKINHALLFLDTTIQLS